MITSRSLSTPQKGKSKREDKRQITAGQNMLGPRYRDFIDAIKRHVGAPIDQKPISLFTIIFVGGGGVAMRGLGMALMFAAHLAMAWFSTPSDLGKYFILIGVTNIVATAGSLGFGAGRRSICPGIYRAAAEGAPGRIHLHDAQSDGRGDSAGIGSSHHCGSNLTARTDA
jgi:hypothetical protein